MNSISYHQIDIDFILPNKRLVSSWIRSVVGSENFSLIHINIIFCSDPHLLSINQQYLQHDYFTDIITFNQSDDEVSIEGDLFISIDRIRDNSSKLEIPFIQELHRVIIHGVLHLIGYDDLNAADKLAMREKEDSYLSLRNPKLMFHVEH
jgi:rRNA maturation RNase YbeY